MFGRVPFAFYVAHLYLIHLLSVLLGVAQGFRPAQMMTMFRFYPKGFGVGLLARLCRLGAGDRRAVSVLPLGRGRQGAASRLVAQLRLRECDPVRTAHRARSARKLSGSVNDIRGSDV